MERVLSLVIYLFALVVLSCDSSKTIQAEVVPSASAIIFTNANVLPMRGDAPVLVRPGQMVVVEGDKISYVGDAKLKFAEGATVIDCSGKYLMPGIAEMHAHIPVPQDGDEAYVREVLFLYLSNGITTIRGMLGQPYHLELKDKVIKGEMLSPRIYTSSPSLNGNTVKTPEEAREKVMKYAGEGYDFLKIHPGIQAEVMEELVRTAKEEGMKFAGHVPAAVGVEQAIEYGYASIDHLDGYIDGLVPESGRVDPDSGGLFGYNFTDLADPGRIPSLVAQTKKNGVWIVPTQSLLDRWTSPKAGAEMANEPEMVYISGKSRFQWRQMKDNITGSPAYSEGRTRVFIELRRRLLRQMHDEGFGLLLGSDGPQVFNVPGFSIQHEMRSWAEAGIPNSAILKAGTVNVARFFGADEAYGSVSAGASADLLLLDGNPIEDIGNMRLIEGVMVRGHWLPKEEIERRLEEIAEGYDN